ncbi:hypothetical protein Agabi119p4_3953 [Agaricus bisporus var. burnettii]|uniref:Helicase C-terminal domain-containing protein n=1 Tax=Agaricus bisporus var. burnettii TaxID=192524 RepID=A0A8H7F5S6_AGABI|nr:hypothetical protein Agabi119p4_3953 [Agaricus bisporus var. burnettii]
MHVGPTNSGKTHHALRALAAAKTGVYAGPLRLLAHEIWERLNLGQIVPLGVEQPPPHANPPPPSHPSQGAALYTAPQDSRPSTNSKYARATNMTTGEEKKVVEHYAGLLSCTVEMLSSRMEYDVGVIDEIQMIGDPQRGFAWTSAVLGLSARELHLCGEASAIPIVQSFLQETGDDLEIRQYERLTPLLVEEESLGGDLSKVQKGDCVIAFSRTSIFALKTEIEKKSGLKCAVVYGKLPPEIRSEQAALFNDPDSGFDVIIGSDAIGMGLNLKIRRIIFSAVTKGDGASSSKVPLSISQTKQIAGRAGRYGHSIDPSNSCGYVTTLHPKDLPFVKDALSHPSTPTLSHAYVGPTVESMEAFCAALPISKSHSQHNSLFPTSSSGTNLTSFLESIQMAHVYTASVPPAYKYINTTSPSGLEKLSRLCSWIEKHSKGVLTWEDKICWLVSPMAVRDDLCVKCYEVIIRRQRDDMDVGDLKDVLEETSRIVYGQDVKKVSVGEMNKEPKGFLQVLEWAEEQMRKHSESLQAVAVLEKEVREVNEEKEEEEKEEDARLSTRNRQPFIPEITHSTLSVLESFHKILVFYMWMLFRNSVVFSDQETTEELKRRVEVVLDWSLQVIGQSDQDKTDGKDMEKVRIAKEERMLSERAAYKQLMKDYQERNAKNETEQNKEERDSREMNRSREEETVGSSAGFIDVLKNYVENPNLRVGRGGAAAAAPSKSVS